MVGKPNLICIGAQKCGTTALYVLLDQHPDCSVGRIKESRFFVDSTRFEFDRWQRGPGWYEALYPTDARLVADISPSYTMWPAFPGVPERAASVLPDATILYLVRDPVDRVVSHWRHWTWRRYERRPLEEAVRAHPEVYIVPTLYGLQLKQWQDVYPASQLMVMHQREVRDGGLRLLERFGLAPAEQTGMRANASDDKRIDRFRFLPTRVHRRLPLAVRSRPVPDPDVSPALRAWILEQVGADVLEFEASTGVDVFREEHRAAVLAQP